MFSQTADLYDLFYAEKDYRGEALRVHELISERNPAAGTLLDVACGTGRHLEHLASRYEAEGTDLDAGLLAVAGRRLPGTPLHRADMRTLDLGRTYDAVTCLFSSIGYLASVDELRAAVASMARHLAPAGALVIEPWLTPEAFDPGHPAEMLVVSAADVRAARTNSVRLEGRRSVMDFHYLIAHAGSVEHVVETHDLGLFTDEEMRSALTDAGLTVEHDPDGLTGRGLWIGQR